MRRSLALAAATSLTLAGVLGLFQNCAKGFRSQSASSQNQLGGPGCDPLDPSNCGAEEPGGGTNTPPPTCPPPVLGSTGNSGSANAVQAGTITTPHPTLQNLTVEWPFSGDLNNNSQVLVRYHKQGDANWYCGMPLRLIPSGNLEGFSWATRHSGSIFDLQPATAYELELTLNDPDGGSVRRTVVVNTRAVPAPMAGAVIKLATPSTLNSVLSAAQPGDVVELGGGSYSGFQINKSGQAGKPLVIRGTPNAVITGEVGAFSANHLIFEDLTINGRLRLNGSSNIAVTGCHIRAATAQGGDGIVSYTRSEDFYIADNWVEGTTRWAESSLGVNGDNLGEGILVTGPGHVITHNHVSGFRDGISFMEDSEAEDQFSLDVLNNDISQNADDGVEADFCQHNCRIMNNRLTNNFIALSSQPSLGGPTYFIRNSIYNAAHVAFKLYRGSIGDLLLHNTIVKNGDGLGIYAGRSVSRAMILNNIFIGGPGGDFGGYSSGTGKVIAFADLVVANSTINYQAYGSTSGSLSGTIGSTSFSNLASLRSTTQEKNAIQVDLGSFAATVSYPATPMTPYGAVDLRLNPASPAVDAAYPISNVNDRHHGAGPDIGAFEVGQPAPLFGPRP